MGIFTSNTYSLSIIEVMKDTVDNVARNISSKSHVSRICAAYNKARAEIEGCRFACSVDRAAVKFHNKVEKILGELSAQEPLQKPIENFTPPSIS